MYEFDAVGYLHWAQVLAASQRRTALSLHLPRSRRRLPSRLSPRPFVQFLHKRPLGTYETGGDAVVLIDEIDKGRAIFPNDSCTSLTSTVSHIRRSDHYDLSEVRPAADHDRHQQRGTPPAGRLSASLHLHRIELTEALVEGMESMARLRR